jgi:hypothetical protein
LARPDFEGNRPDGNFGRALIVGIGLSAVVWSLVALAWWRWG